MDTKTLDNQCDNISSKHPSICEELKDYDISQKERFSINKITIHEIPFTVRVESPTKPDDDIKFRNTLNNSELYFFIEF